MLESHIVVERKKKKMTMILSNYLIVTIIVNSIYMVALPSFKKMLCVS